MILVFCQELPSSSSPTSGAFQAGRVPGKPFSTASVLLSLISDPGLFSVHRREDLSLPFSRRHQQPELMQFLCLFFQLLTMKGQANSLLETHMTALLSPHPPHRPPKNGDTEKPTKPKSLCKQNAPVLSE